MPEALAFPPQTELAQGRGTAKKRSPGRAIHALAFGRAGPCA
jgi:hypothetical protein